MIAVEVLAGQFAIKVSFDSYNDAAAFTSFTNDFTLWDAEQQDTAVYLSLLGGGDEQRNIEDYARRYCQTAKMEAISL